MIVRQHVVYNAKSVLSGRRKWVNDALQDSTARHAARGISGKCGGVDCFAFILTACLCLGCLASTCAIACVPTTTWATP
jgi:hypothetical protein